MKKLKLQKSKQIIFIIIILMLCNFIIPNYTYAKDESGGVLLEAIAQFLCFLPDTVLNYLQEMFISTDEIDDTATGEYKILYAPAAIFSGEIPAFDINFINPKGESKTSVDLDDDAIVIGGGITELEITNSEINNYYGGNSYDVMTELIENGKVLRTDGKVLKLKGETFKTEHLNQISNSVSFSIGEILDACDIEYDDESTFEVSPERSNNWRY